MGIRKTKRSTFERLFVALQGFSQALLRPALVKPSQSPVFILPWERMVNQHSWVHENSNQMGLKTKWERKQQQQRRGKQEVLVLQGSAEWLTSSCYRVTFLSGCLSISSIFWMLPALGKVLYSSGLAELHKCNRLLSFGHLWSLLTFGQTNPLIFGNIKWIPWSIPILGFLRKNALNAKQGLWAGASATG